MERARGSGSHTHKQPSSPRSHAGGPRPQARLPLLGLPLPAAVQPQLQDAPPCADFTLRLPGVGSRHLAFASLRLPREESPQGRYKDRSLAKG